MSAVPPLHAKVRILYVPWAVTQVVCTRGGLPARRMAAPRKRAVMDDDHSDDEEVAVTGACRNNADDKLARAQREGRVIELDDDEGPSSSKRQRTGPTDLLAVAHASGGTPQQIFSLEMRRIHIGTFDCGACTLVFESDKCSFFVEEGRVLPNGGSVAVPITLPITNMSRMEVSKKRAVMCITGFFCLDQFGDHYEEYSNLGAEPPALSLSAVHPRA